jgi:hypothetical protein
MSNKHTEQPSLHFTPEKLLAFASALLGRSPGREDDEHPLPPGPWDPVVRAALERVAVSARAPAFEEAALNPQPLPPRFAFLRAVVQSLLTRAELLQEIADASRRTGEQQGIIIVGGYTSRFSDDWCGNGFRLKYPFPGPRPNWFAAELDATDLVVVALQLEQAAKDAFSPELRRPLADASSKFLTAAFSKLR